MPLTEDAVMTTIDYMKVIDIAADTMGAVANITMDAFHDKVDRCY